MHTSLATRACSVGGSLSHVSASATDIFSALTRAVRGCGAGGAGSRSSTDCTGLSSGLGSGLGLQCIQ